MKDDLYFRVKGREGVFPTRKDYFLLEGREGVFIFF